MNLKAFIILMMISSLDSRITVDLQEMHGCPGHSYDIDFSNVEFDFDYDGYLIVSGNFTFLKDVVEPYAAYFHSDHMERGEWRPAIIHKNVPDFCAVIQSPLEVWYPVTQHLSKKRCPYKAGSVVHFDTVRYKFPVAITPNFLGEWRMFMEQRDVTKDPKPFACLMQYFSVIEI
ncbi:uncharacterized protein LOC134217039 [Armigeres subalbatus]|uniref:uncharacterized protein LOC134217039 n=1 Tax=Armigeres subalbatus TaxID=124917 RepID=UPI002ED17C11